MAKRRSAHREGLVPSGLVVVGLVAALALMPPSVARAHGGRPQTYDVLFDPSDARTIVVPASFGLLLSEDAGATFSLICSNASPDPRPGTFHPTVISSAGTLLVARELGLVRGADHGCGLAYAEVEPASAYFADVIAHPGADALVLRSDAATANALYLARADGTRLEALRATFPTDFLPERVRVAPSDRLRFWVSGTAGRAGTTFVDGRVYVSRDGGASHEVHTIPLELDERRLRVLAVDPSDADRAIAVIHALGEDRPLELRLVAGELEVRRLPALAADRMRVDRAFAAAFLPDGTVWLGNDLGGLWALERSGEMRVIDADLGLSCAVVHDGHVYLCADDVPDALGDGFAIARQRLGAPYAPEPVLRYRDILGPRACGGPSDAVCAAQWPETLVDLGRGGELDAGVALDHDADPPSLDATGLDAPPMEASAASDAGPVGPTTPSCACALDAQRRPPPTALFLSLACALAALARKRRPARARASPSTRCRRTPRSTAPRGKPRDRWPARATRAPSGGQYRQCLNTDQPVSLFAHPMGGHIYAAWQGLDPSSQGGASTSIYFSRSTNTTLGAWTVPVQVNPRVAGSATFFVDPTITVDSSGFVLITYSGIEPDQTAPTATVFSAYSANNGTSFMVAARTSPPTWQPAHLSIHCGKHFFLLGEYRDGSTFGEKHYQTYPHSQSSRVTQTGLWSSRRSVW